MANVFKVITKSSVSVDSSTPTDLIEVPTSKTEIILSLMLANKHTSSIKVTVLIESDTTQAGGHGANETVKVLNAITVDEETSLEVMSGQKYILNTTDKLQIYADNANIDVVLSYMEQDV